MSALLAQANKSSICAALTVKFVEASIILMSGDGGHLIGLKIVPGGTSSFFDANAGLYQFPSVDDLRAFWRAAYDAAEYGFTSFKLVTFNKMPSL